MSQNLKKSRVNTSLLAVVYHSCTSTPLYQSAHNIWSA